MTPEHIALVQRSFADVLPIADTAAALFYERLFMLDPTLRSCSTAICRSKGASSWPCWHLAVAGLSRLEELVPIVQALGVASSGLWRARRALRHGGCRLAVDAGGGAGLSASPRRCKPPGPTPIPSWLTPCARRQRRRLPRKPASATGVAVGSPGERVADKKYKRHFRAASTPRRQPPLASGDGDVPQRAAAAPAGAARSQVERRKMFASRRRQGTA